VSTMWLSRTMLKGGYRTGAGIGISSPNAYAPMRAIEWLSKATATFFVSM
jgi:hypothetical protein